MKYAITSQNSEYWTLTTCKTLAGAKRKATSEFGAGYNDDILMVAEQDDNGRKQVVATKGNYPGAAWVDRY
jgi:hypothetical protein